MNYIRKSIALLMLALFIGSGSQAYAETYAIDIKGAHAFINFRIKHLGYSWLYGRFDKFNGSFEFDENNPAASSVNVTIDTSSVNSNHAARDNHLRARDILNVRQYPEATFNSTDIRLTGSKSAVITGRLTLRGVTKTIQIKASYVGGGTDPWGGFRRGFIGTTTLRLADFGIPINLGPASTEVELTLSVEGIRER